MAASQGRVLHNPSPVILLWQSSKSGESFTRIAARNLNVAMVALVMTLLWEIANNLVSPVQSRREDLTGQALLCFKMLQALKWSDDVIPVDTT
jgi:hypothetical protein